MKLSLFRGSLPKVGIRPTIDGRLGGRLSGAMDQAHGPLIARTEDKRPAAIVVENLPATHASHEVLAGETA